MKVVASLIGVLLLAGCGGSSGPGSEDPNQLSAEVCQKSAFVTDESSAAPVATSLNLNHSSYIVQFKESSRKLRPSGNAKREYQVAGVTISVIGADTYKMNFGRSFKSSEEKRQTLENMAKDPDVDFIEPDYPVYRTDTAMDDQAGIPNDRFFDRQWSHKVMNSVAAWKKIKGSKKIVVAVVDTGIDYKHRDLAENMWRNPGEVLNGIDDDKNGYVDDIYGYNFVDNNNDPRTTPKSNHGSHVAGIIGAKSGNSIGIAGMAPEVQLMALKFMGDGGSGATSDAIRAIDYAIQKKVFLINNSWGSNSYSRALAQAISRAEKAGILFVVAAGNGLRGVGYDLKDTAWYPASYPNSNVLTVAATNNYDRLTKFSNFSASKVDVAAPGYSILSTVTGEAYQMMSGTSMAAPYVSGLAVLVKATNPSLTPSRIIDIVRNTVDRRTDLVNRVNSGGRINAYRAVLAAAKCTN